MTNQTQFEGADFEDFEDLDTYLNSKEFNDLYNSLPASRRVSVYDDAGMTFEDISGLPAPESAQWSYK